MKAARQVALIGTLLALPLGMAVTLRAQTAAAQITGTVKDTSGAAMPDVKVALANQLTGLTREATTGAGGDYVFPLLPVGVYSVTAEMPGFQLAKQSGISLAVADVKRIDLEMKVGDLTETVEVIASAVALDTETSAVTHLVNQRQVNELPLNGRNFVQFLLLGAGAVTIDGEQGVFTKGKGNAISINGARPTSLNYMLDGLVNTSPGLNTPAVVLSQDAILEFKEQTATYSAEYGFSANQINIVSKSGTNELHGSVFEFLRNDAVDARNTFSATKPVLRQNQFGFVAGGPVYIPKVYDGRNKSFFLANYEGWRIREGTILQGLLPSPTQVNGDFSNSGLPAFGTPECSNALAAGGPCMPIDPVTGQPFPGNQIPSNRFSRLATETLALPGTIAAPNCDPAVCAGNNFRILAMAPTTLNQQTYKGDQVLGRWGWLMGRYTKSRLVTTTPRIPPGGYANLARVHPETSWMLSHTINFGPATVNSFRFGSLTAGQENCPGTTAPQSSIDGIGLTGVFTGLDDCQRSYPQIAIGNFSDVGGIFFGGGERWPVKTWEFSEGLTTFRGKHTLAVGFQYRPFELVTGGSTGFNGFFQFVDNQILTNGGSGLSDTKGCTTPFCGTGNAVADFLLGYYNSAWGGGPGPFTEEVGSPGFWDFKLFSAYIQDDWKVTPRLTLNMGLRWDFRSVPYEKNDHTFWRDVENTRGGFCFSNEELVTQGIAPPGNEFYRFCGRRAPANGSKKVFAPRFGFAYRPWGDKTVVRAGYGVFFDSAEAREIVGGAGNYPYGGGVILNPATQSVTEAPKLTNQLFPAQSELGPAGIQHVFSGGLYPSAVPRNPYVQQWTFSIQRELFKDTTLEVNYIGNKGLHLLTRRNIARAFSPSNPDFCAAKDAGGNYINLAQGDCPVVSRRPFPNFGLHLDSQWAAHSNYHSGNVKLERRTSALALQAVYTWAKSLDNKSAAAGIGGAAIGWSGFLDDHRPDIDYGRSEFNVDHRLVANFVYELPFGRGSKYLGSANKAVDAVLGGWQVSGIVTLQRGFPMTAYGTDTLCLLDVPFCAPSNRADLVGDPLPSGFKRTTDKFFNTDAFVSAEVAHYGNSGRGILRGPGLNNWDLGLAKTFSITESLRMQFRAEMFNAFNHPQYNRPGTHIVFPTYGRVGSARAARIIQFGLKVLF